jgi:hypothetical protein
LIWEIGQRGGRFDLQEAKLGFLSACLADRPRSPCGLSARNNSASCSSCSSRVLERFRFDPFGQLFLAGSGFADRPPRRRGPSARHELLADRPRTRCRPYVFQGVLPEVLLAFSDRPPRTVHRPHGDSPPGHRRPFTWACTELLSPLLLEFCFCFGIVWGLFLGLVGTL